MNFKRKELENRLLKVDYINGYKVATSKDEHGTVNIFITDDYGVTSYIEYDIPLDYIRYYGEWEPYDEYDKDMTFTINKECLTPIEESYNGNEYRINKGILKGLVVQLNTEPCSMLHFKLKNNREFETISDIGNAFYTDYQDSETIRKKVISLVGDEITIVLESESYSEDGCFILTDSISFSVYISNS